MDSFTPTRKTRVRRLPERGHYDRATVYRILDAGLIAHVGYVIDGQPFVTPTAYWRHGDRVYWHGSAASRMLRTIAAGVKACLTVTHFDGLVLARSGFNHSINYRSVMAFGTAEPVAEESAKLRALEDFLERVYPGRWRELRAPTRQEIKATSVFAMALDEVSAKVRVGPPHDDEEDYAVPCWAGELPMSLVPGAPVPDSRLLAGMPLPDYLRRFVLAREGA